MHRILHGFIIFYVKQDIFHITEMGWVSLYLSEVEPPAGGRNTLYPRMYILPKM